MRGQGMATHTLRLRDFGFGVRLGLTLLAVVIVGGSTVSGLYLRSHHDNRDEREGFTLDDIRAHYHGIQSKSPMLGALERGHPEDLDTAQRQVLIDWLTSDRVREDYDNFDLGENMPEEIIAVGCVSCHDSGATGAEAYPELSLRYFDDVMANALSREINPVSLEVLTASLHAHSLALGTMCLVMVLLVALAVRFLKRPPCEDPARCLMAKTARYLAEAGCPRREHETVRRYLRRCAETLPELSKRLERLDALYHEARYKEEKKALERLKREVKELTRLKIRR